MNNSARSLSMIPPAGFLATLCMAALGFQYLAVKAFDVGTDHEYIPQLKSNPAGVKCVKQR